MNKVRIAAAALPAGLPVRLLFAAAAVLVALLLLPHAGHAQGIVRGAQEGSYEGNRIAGPEAARSAASSVPVSAARWAQ